MNRWVLVFLGVLFLAPTVSSQSVSSPSPIGASGPPTVIPPLGANINGFRCKLRAGRMRTTGYVPIEIKFVSTATFPADRDFVVRFRGVDGDVTPPQRNLLVDVPVSVAQGTASYTVVRYLPRWTVTGSTEVSILEDGRPIPEYQSTIVADPSSARISTFRYLTGLVLPEFSADLLLITDSDSDSTLLAYQAFPSMNLVAEADATLSESEFELADPAWKMLGGSDTATMMIQERKQLPDDWRGYQVVDGVLVDYATLKKIFRSSDSDAPAAIRAWVMLGGTLLVGRSESEQETLNLIGMTGGNQSLEIRTTLFSLRDSWQRSLETLKSMQRQAEQDARNGAMLSVDNSYSWNGGYAIIPSLRPSQELPPGEFARQTESVISALEQAIARSDEQWGKRMWSSQVGAGRVIGFCAEQANESSATAVLDWHLAKSLIGYRASPTLRRGVDPMIGSSRFRDWLIPGVAQPPVYTFMGLLTAFVVLVGPIAYRQTTKNDRGYLMFAIAPALALVTTLLMFGYGIIADGFGTQARIRQIAIVDAASGQAVERTRSTYFAGVRPSDGIRFAADAEVMSFPETMGKSWEEQHRRSPEIIGTVVVDETEQRFDSSFLPSRQQTQFVTHQARFGFGRLTATPTDDNRLSVTNGFGCDLDRLILADDQGIHWSIENIAAGSKVVAVPIDAKKVSRTLGALYNEHRPIMSAVEQSSGNANSGEVYNLINEIANGIAAGVSIESGAMEHELQSLVQSRGTLAPGTFVAMTAPSEDALAVENVKVVASVRYVMGTYEMKLSEPPKRSQPEAAK